MRNTFYAFHLASAETKSIFGVAVCISLLSLSLYKGHSIMTKSNQKAGGINPVTDSRARSASPFNSGDVGLGSIQRGAPLIYPEEGKTHPHPLSMAHRLSFTFIQQQKPLPLRLTCNFSPMCCCVNLRARASIQPCVSTRLLRMGDYFPKGSGAAPPTFLLNVLLRVPRAGA